MNFSLKIEDFTWSFLEVIVSWSVLLAFGVALVAALFRASASFVISFAVAAQIDIGSLWLMAYVGHRRIEAGENPTAYVGKMTVGRVLGKASLIVVATLLPAVDLLGVIVGVLVVDTTILLVGSIASTWKVMRDNRSVSTERRG